jgi:hypothetical protein
MSPTSYQAAPPRVFLALDTPYHLKMVPRPGIEPGRALGPRDFKSLASASSAISAKTSPIAIPGFKSETVRLNKKVKKSCLRQKGFNFADEVKGSVG